MNRAQAPERCPSFDTMPIAGEWRAGASGRSRADHDPWSGETLAEIPLASADDVEEAFGAALSAQREWAETAPAERAAVLRRAAAILEDRKAELLDWLVRESGGTLAKAELEWSLVRAGLHEAATMPHHVEGRIMPSDVPARRAASTTDRSAWWP
ncbi:hypothetical protein GCM10027597_39020 [Saccharopolyspora tripterygii]